MRKYFSQFFTSQYIKIYMIIVFFSVHVAFCDSISTSIDFMQWQKRMQFTPQQKACATCDFTIAFPLRDLNTEDSQIELFSGTIPPSNTAKNIDLLLQDVALQNLFEEDSMQSQEDSTQYTFLGQRQYDKMLEDMTSKNTTNNISLSKSIFMKKDIAHAYAEILKHKGVFSCMYCGELDKVAKILPLEKTQIAHHNVHYSYTPLKDSYQITISDNICGTIDNLIFIQDKDSVELWVYSRFECKAKTTK